jgi:hypothetical protein
MSDGGTISFGRLLILDASILSMPGLSGPQSYESRVCGHKQKYLPRIFPHVIGTKPSMPATIPVSSRRLQIASGIDAVPETECTFGRLTLVISVGNGGTPHRASSAASNTSQRIIPA